jgi:hypothetical protein
MSLYFDSLQVLISVPVLMTLPRAAKFSPALMV